MTIHQRFDDLRDDLNRLNRNGRGRQLVRRMVDGVHLVTPEGRRILNFGGNDYLGLVADKIHASVAVNHGGSTASALVCGWSPSHQQLADRIASFESSEAAVLFPSGYAACSGTVAALARKGDLLLSDQLNHASLIDGCRLSKAETKIYRHRDVGHLRQLIASRRDRYQRVWIVTDAVFSMDGTLAPLAKLCALAEELACELIVDEAHGTGVLGDDGCGLCQATGLQDRVAVRIGTLSKAIGCQGGFVASDKVIIDYLINHCRSLIFSTSLSPLVVRAANVSLDVIQKSSERRDHLAAMTRLFRQCVASHIELGELESQVPIVPIIIGDDESAVRASTRLADAGYYVPVIRPPTVPDGTSRLRVSISASHSDEMIRGLADAIVE